MVRPVSSVVNRYEGLLQIVRIMVHTARNAEGGRRAVEIFNEGSTRPLIQSAPELALTPMSGGRTSGIRKKQRNDEAEGTKSREASSSRITRHQSSQSVHTKS